MLDSDAALIAQAQRGDRMAFEQLVYRYDAQVLKLALRYTRNREDAKDVYQEVFIRVYRSLKNFRFQSSFSTWLYRIAVNTCLSFESRRSREQHLPLEGWPENDNHRPAGFETASPESGAYEKTAGSEIAAEIAKALDALSPQQRVVFILKHFHDLRLKEIGSLLNCSEGTVKKHLFVATQKMRDRLKDFVQ